MGLLVSKSGLFFSSLLVSQVKQIPSLVCSNQLGESESVGCSNFLVLKIFFHVLILIVCMCVGDRRPFGDNVYFCF